MEGSFKHYAQIFNVSKVHKIQNFLTQENSGSKICAEIINHTYACEKAMRKWERIFQVNYTITEFQKISAIYS